MFDQLTIGAWVITTADCPVRFVPNPQEHQVTLILGDTHREFEICLDAKTLAMILHLGGKALTAASDTGVVAPSPNHDTKVPSSATLDDPTVAL
ncbi:hypothetical protein KHQ06_34215 [Nocardia tengchongensis]|uniref:Uncharacterized protein n=1 Tax=Nocardia tengchongensis TaxID=2055889 RepID=A0ABX8CM68_9NOCA|nr:hypothetical protein [Nocardia tengchongensis]QVI21048.1 hypothetical protein KHQ06_34215 [Nocardia tengchongensis]